MGRTEYLVEQNHYFTDENEKHKLFIYEEL